MTVPDFVAGLEAEGFTIWEKDGSLAVRPARNVTPTMRETLTALGPEILAFVRGRPLGVDWSKVSLYQLDHILEIGVPWCDVPLILAPGCRVARELRQMDPKPGIVWCVCEAIDLLLTSVPPEDAQRIGQAKLMLGAAITDALSEA